MSHDHPPLDPALELGKRHGLPPDLRVLLENYPRECWSAHRNLGDMARFWMSRHDMFRELGDALSRETERFCAGATPVREFAGWFVPRLQFLLSHLGTHHQIEDHHYFPIFRAADERLAYGFDLLENDHHVIHVAMDRTVETVNVFLRTLSEGHDGDTVKRTSQAFVAAQAPLIELLIKHLDDEEDLIVPLILDRGEEALGVGH